MYAQSLLNLSPWSYFTPEDPRLMTPTVSLAVQHLQRCVQLFPLHPLALHLLIHVYEQSAHPQEGEAYADAMASPPGALRTSTSRSSSHLVHMPGHLYCRIGRHDDCVAVGKQAVALDEMYREKCLVPYVPMHNKALLIAAATACGDFSLAALHSLPASQLPEEALLFETGLFPLPTVRTIYSLYTA